jgi:hypothetical protein
MAPFQRASQTRTGRGVGRRAGLLTHGGPYIFTVSFLTVQNLWFYLAGGPAGLRERAHSGLCAKPRESCDPDPHTKEAQSNGQALSILFMAGLGLKFYKNAPALALRDWLRSTYNFLCLFCAKCSTQVRDAPHFHIKIEVIYTNAFWGSRLAVVMSPSCTKPRTPCQIKPRILARQKQLRKLQGPAKRA